MWIHSKENLEKLTPDLALTFLKEGNQRFLNNLKSDRNLLRQVNQTSGSQFPFAVILSCIDSRTSAELIFDQGLGDIFSIRIAGNILNEDILGSMEYACKIANSKLIVVLGHTKCAAITAACNNTHLGHFTVLLNKIRPAVDEETETVSLRNGNNASYVNNVSIINVKITLDQIRERSKILSDLETQGLINIIGGLYDVETGEVKFYEE